MPEGPEVKLITECLNKFVKGSRLKEVRISENSKYSKKAPDGYKKFSESLPLKVTKVHKKGKFMYWELGPKNGQQYYMYNHLMMTGCWGLERDDYTTLEFVFNNCVLYYSDKRRFGRVEFVDSESSLEEELAKIGPDMMEPGIKPSKFLEIMRSCNKKNIGVAMMEQAKISGIGNYLRSEILYSANINPHNKVQDLSDKKLKELFAITKNLLETSYNLKGCSLQDFKNLEGEKGGFQKQLNVYKRKKDPHGNDVTNDKIGGRSVFWVKKIQQ